MVQLMNMTRKEAINVINKDKCKYEQYANYYEVAILPLLE
jgi:hypothetical protein